MTRRERTRSLGLRLDGLDPHVILFCFEARIRRFVAPRRTSDYRHDVSPQTGHRDEHGTEPSESGGAPHAGTGRPRFTLKIKLLAGFSLLFLMVIGTVFSISLSHQRRLLFDEIEKRGRMTASYLAVSARDAVLEADLLTLSTLVGAVQHDPDLVMVDLRDRHGRILMHSDVSKVESISPAPPASSRGGGTAEQTAPPAQEDPASLIEIVEPIAFQGKTIGTLRLRLSTRGVEGLVRHATNSLYTTMGIALVLGVVGTVLLTKTFLRQVDALAKATSEVAGGDFDVSVRIDSHDEIGQLGASFNQMTERLKLAHDELERGHISTTLALAGAVEAKDPYTSGHCTRVSSYAMEIGKCIGLAPAELKQLELASILHDIGKIGIKDEILVKPGRLTFKEVQIMRAHPRIGQQILQRVKPLRYVAECILSHHEALDGKGYPQGLKGDRIPLISRIITVADSYDAMSTSRPYREALPPERAIARLVAAKGRQFDPVLVEAFVHLNELGVIDRIRRTAFHTGLTVDHAAHADAA